MTNIIFSTTRQWNPGDEFILRGIRNILIENDVDHNPIIYNRNPDVRSCYQDRQLFKTSKVRNDFNSNQIFIDIEANIKFGSFDNSLKPNTNCKFASWVVLAGTPEWSNGKMYDLYAAIRRYDIPLLIVGVGGGCDIYHEHYREIIEKAKLITVRDPDTLDSVRKQGFTATYLPCPALLAAPRSRERKIDVVQKIALIYQGSRDETVIWNGFAKETYAYMLEFFRLIIAEFAKTQNYEFEIICHYVDEIPLATRDFPDLRLRYSFDAQDYIDIYSQFDLVIGPRVHGIGIAASLCIPGVALVHDPRGSTCAGFLAAVVSPNDSLERSLGRVVEAITNVAAKNDLLKAHKIETMNNYKELIRNAMNNSFVSYDRRHDLQLGRTFEISDLADFYDIINNLRSDNYSDQKNMKQTAFYESMAPEMRQRLINIEAKINHLLNIKK